MFAIKKEYNVKVFLNGSMVSSETVWEGGVPYRTIARVEELACELATKHGFKARRTGPVVQLLDGDAVKGVVGYDVRLGATPF